MAGNQTNGFDMVIEVSATTIQNIVSGIFDSDGFLGSMFPNTFILDGFSLTVGFNRPSDIPASAVNPIELLLDLDFRGDATGQMRMVAGLNVDRTRDDVDLVQIDLTNNLYLFQLSINGASLNLVNNFVSDKLKEQTIPLFPIPVQRTSTNTLDMIRADVKIIDDTSGTNGDALGVMLTFGGGTAGNLNAFTSAFAREGAGAAIAVRFAWICRNISTRIENAIGLSPGDFNNCTFRGDHEIREGVRLTALDIAPSNDSIRLSGTVAKSGFCYEASGTIGANIFVGIEAGELRVRFTTDQPVIDVDIPWYCWIGGAVIGALLGGVILGVIGTIVGAILVPLILHIAQTTVESTVQSVADSVTNSIGDVNVTAPLGPIGTILDRAFIDDLTITYEMFPEEYAEIKSEGILNVPNGFYFDLDNGIVKNSSFSGADVRLLGNGSGRRIKALCGTSIGQGIAPKFDQTRRFHLYKFDFNIPEIPFHEVAIHIPIPFVDDQYFTTFKIFGVKTSDGCYSILQVFYVDDSFFHIKYRTYQLENFKVRIKGSFSCNPYLIGFENMDIAGIEYLDSFTVNKKFSQSLMDHVRLTQLTNLDLQLNNVAALRKSDSEMSLLKFDEKQLQTMVNKKALEYNRAVGYWVSTSIFKRKSKTGHFKAVIDGNVTISNIHWMVDGNSLKNDSEGKVKVKGETFEYKTNGVFLTLSSTSAKVLDVPIKVTIHTEMGSEITEIRCVPYKNECKTNINIVPKFSEYLEKFDKEYGVVKVPIRSIG